MKSSWALVVCLILIGGCATDRPGSDAAGAHVPTGKERGSTGAVDPELKNKEFIFDVLQYLYRWHTDPREWNQSRKEFDVWVQSVRVPTDEGDRSRFAEMWVPKLGLMIEMKKADHDVPERKMVLKDSRFKVRAVHRLDASAVPSANWSVIHLSYGEVVTHLSQSRSERLFPSPALEKRLESALADYLRRHQLQEVGSRSLQEGTQTFDIAPISAVSDEMWIYWEDQQTAIRFAADGDVDNPGIWDEPALNLRLVRLEGSQNVPLLAGTLAPPSSGDFYGGGKHVSREWAGRLLYNCIVLGRRFTLSFAPAAP